MKKTIIALMALAGVAMGAETITIESSDWNQLEDNKGYTLDLSSKPIDLTADNWVLTLTMDVVAGTATNQWGSGAISTGSNPLGGFYDYYAMEANNSADGLQSYITKGGEVRFVGGGICKGTLGLTPTTDAAPIGTIDANKKVTLVYTLTRTGENTTLSITADGTAIAKEITLSNEKCKWDHTVSTLSSTLTDTQTAAGWTLASGSFTIVPEPATATLSLLALAGLCARRRRA